MVYKCTVRMTKIIEAPSKEEAVDKFLYLFSLGHEDIDVVTVGKGAEDESFEER